MVFTVATLPVYDFGMVEESCWLLSLLCSEVFGSILVFLVVVVYSKKEEKEKKRGEKKETRRMERR